MLPLMLPKKPLFWEPLGRAASVPDKLLPVCVRSNSMYCELEPGTFSWYDPTYVPVNEGGGVTVGGTGDAAGGGVGADVMLLGYVYGAKYNVAPG